MSSTRVRSSLTRTARTSAAVLSAMAILGVAGCSSSTPESESGPANADGTTSDVIDTEPVIQKPLELPGGGTEFFPGRRIVALYGHPGDPGLGALGEQGPEEAVGRAEALAAQYEGFDDIPVVPAFEIIATVAHQEPGPNGDYSGAVDVETLRPWVERAGDAGVYVLLDLQPGRADFLDQARMYEELLKYPHVGLALDPEWKLRPDQYPLQEVGSVDADEVNAVTDWLNEVVSDHELPQKLLVVHQFQLRMVQGADRLVYQSPGVQLLLHMDGQGVPAEKEDTWEAVRGAAPEGTPLGWKNFYDEDSPMFDPAATMNRLPLPLMISYQ